MTWSDVIKAAVSLLIAVLTALLPYLTVLLHRHLNGRQINTLVQVANVAVRAVNQIAGTGGMANEAKYALAVHFIEHLSEKAHITLTDDQLKPLVEAAVEETKGWNGQSIQTSTAPPVTP